MKKIITEDGSTTFYNEQYDEPYHTKSGAEEEAMKKHAEALKVWEKENPVIYDYCFGLGYNTAAAIDAIRQRKNNKKITIHGFENDKEILDLVLSTETNFRSYHLIKKLIENIKRGKNEYEQDNIKLIMHLGDAIKEVKKDIEKADYVFFDPFSPKKHPEMWAEQVFRDLYKNMRKCAKLSTYSYARITRENLEKAGFKVEKGPIIGRRSPSTIAIKL